MDQKRMTLAIAISIAIVMVWYLLVPQPPRHQPPASHAVTQSEQPTTAPKPPGTIGATPQDMGSAPVGAAAEASAPALTFDGPRVSGTISLLGARIDRLVLKDYHETVSKQSPLVQLLEPLHAPQPTVIQFGWTADGKVKVPDANTVWTQTSPGQLTPTHPVTLSWNNGQGQTFEQTFALDDNYMFTVQQRVRNNTDAPVSVYSWGRVLRTYTPQTAGYSVLHEGLIGWVGTSEHDMTYAAAKKDGSTKNGLAFQGESIGGWLGFTDKYWLEAVVPDQAANVTMSYRYIESDRGGYQADYVSATPLTAPAHGDAMQVARSFVGAKEVHLLNHYERDDGISHLSYAIDWGWFWFLTKPIYYALDWLYAAIGNFGVAIILFTFCVKLLFFPLANFSYRSMSKMKLLAPKMQAIREQYKDDSAKQQQMIMQMYKAEKVNPASGCLPMLLQVPVFFSLYKVIFINIDMRHAPFFGWIHDLSAVDPTNVFNLFGLLPFDPAASLPLLHIGLWPILMGLSMWAQQKMNPPPPDPTQAKLFQLMPIIFTFMLARFPAGLVIYWTTNNLLTVAQQWFIMRQTRLSKPSLART